MSVNISSAVAEINKYKGIKMKRKFVGPSLMIIAALMVMFLVFGCGNDMENPTSIDDSAGVQLAPAVLDGGYATVGSPEE